MSRIETALAEDTVGERTNAFHHSVLLILPRDALPSNEFSRRAMWC